MRLISGLRIPSSMPSRFSRVPPTNDPHQTRDHVLEAARTTHNPACQPTCYGTDADLNRDGTLIESRQRLVIDADADRGAEARLNLWLCLGSRPAGDLLRTIRHARDMGTRGEGA
jgi:hypothetical protein